MDFPKLNSGQYAVLKAKFRQSLFLGLGPHLDLGSGRWRVFDTFAAANEYATAEMAAQPTVECGIYDAREQHVRTLRL